MKRRILLCLVLVVIAVLAARHAASLQTGSIRGSVVDLEERPLEGVVVTLVPASRVATTDAGGRFSFSGVAPGRYRLAPERAGFVSAPTGRFGLLREPGVWVQIDAGEESQDIQLKMAVEGILSGVVTDVKGRTFPSPSASVSLLTHAYDERGRRRLREVPHIDSIVRMNDRGEYRFYGLRSGEYYIRVSGGPFGTRPAVYFPGTTDEREAVPVRLRPGETLELPTITVPLQETGEVRLHFSPAGASASTTGLQVIFGTGTTVFLPPYAQALAIPGQIVLKDVAAGVQDLLVTRGFSRDALYGFATAVVLRDTSVDETIVLRPAIRVNGKLSYKNGRDSSSLRCTMRPDGVGATDLLQSPLGCIGGQFTPGLYWLDVTGMTPDAYVVSATLDGRDILSTGVQLTADAELDVVLDAPGGVIEGQVRSIDGNIAAGAVVVAIPDSPMRSASLLYRSTSTDVRGRYRLSGVAPGAYHVFSWIELEGAAYFNSEFLEEFEEHGHPIGIKKGVQVSVDLVAH